MDIEYLIDIADHATKSLVKRNLIGANINGDEYDDMKQAAILHLLELSQRRDLTPDLRPLLFVRARYAAFQWIYWWKHSVRQCAYFSNDTRGNSTKRKSINVLSIDEMTENGFQLPNQEIIEERKPLSAGINNALFDIFLNTRNKKGQRGMNAAIRDVRIVNYLVMGYGNEGIAFEIGSTKNNISHYRRGIRYRLAERVESDKR